MVKTIAGILLLMILPFTINVLLMKVTLPLAFILAAILLIKIK
jgi:hypothetical protein